MAETLTELHSHLYGCLVEDDLAWLASRRPPKMDYFSASYKSYYGVYPDVSGLFLSANRARLTEYLRFTKPDTFAAFQVCFDLIIACAHTDPDELYNVALRVREREPASYAEYRMLFSPLRGETEFIESLCALTEAFAAPGRTDARLAVSINRRDDRSLLEYQWVRAFQSRYPALAPFLTGLDFCAKEEGFPPRGKGELFQHILADNALPGNHRLDILYHVGESFQDKSVESAVRWVVESADMGAHRLGHAIALGVPPS
ncbi:MAG: hypothetical protein HY042_07665, partial [Spirochaetia bacterium]|nr:hypothetical protein [Spirochaetia bacterium]